MRIFLLALVLLLPFAAQAGKTHVHGTGSLEIAIEKDALAIALALPLDAAVGFEHPPANAKEKAALAAAEKALKDAALFAPTPAAGCALKSVEVHVPFLADGDKHEHAHEGGEHHADVEANHVFRCANPAALKGIETALFRQFKRLYRLEAKRAGPAGQGGGRLTPRQPTLNW